MRNETIERLRRQETPAANGAAAAAAAAVQKIPATEAAAAQGPSSPNSSYDAETDGPLAEEPDLVSNVIVEKVLELDESAPTSPDPEPETAITPQEWQHQPLLTEDDMDDDDDDMDGNGRGSRGTPDIDHGGDDDDLDNGDDNNDNGNDNGDDDDNAINNVDALEDGPVSNGPGVDDDANNDQGDTKANMDDASQPAASSPPERPDDVANTCDAPADDGTDLRDAAGKLHGLVPAESVVT